MKLVPGAPRHLRFSNYAAKKALTIHHSYSKQKGMGTRKVTDSSNANETGSTRRVLQLSVFQSS